MYFASISIIGERIGYFPMRQGSLVAIATFLNITVNSGRSMNTLRFCLAVAA